MAGPGSVPIQYVSLVSRGGTPVTVTDAKGNPYPTTGYGSLVFNKNPVLEGAVFTEANFSNAVLTNPTIINPTFQPQLDQATKVFVSEVAPEGVQPNTLWWSSTDGQLYVLYNDGDSQQWVPATPAVGTSFLASPAFTGNPTAPTPAPGDNDTSIATTAFV